MLSAIPSVSTCLSLVGWIHDSNGVSCSQSRRRLSGHLTRNCGWKDTQIRPNKAAQPWDNVDERSLSRSMPNVQCSMALNGGLDLHCLFSRYKRSSDGLPFALLLIAQPSFAFLAFRLSQPSCALFALHILTLYIAHFYKHFNGRLRIHRRHPRTLRHRRSPRP
jgi:hypothetical protein